MRENENFELLAKERTLLAAERTFSAWLRTGLATMAGGIAILRLMSFKTDTHQLIAHIAGEALILWSCFLILLSWVNYKKIEKAMVVSRNYKALRSEFLVIVLPLLVISSLLIWVTL